ncbi:hypothetical protein JCM6882_007176 [Rhodosporidiobolus microsporus]
MAPSSAQDSLLVQIPPHTSPVLQPTHHRHHRNTPSSTANHRNPDLPAEDELEFLAPGQWDESAGHFTEDDETSDDGDDTADEDDGDPDDDIEDWSLEDGHIAGVPCANVRLDAKHSHTPDFLDTLFQLLRHDLSIPGWNTLPYDTPSSLIQVHRVSGSLTNAVFFVSIPDTEVELEMAVPFDSPEEVSEAERGFPPLNQLANGSSSGEGTPVVNNSARAFPATVFGELERGRQAAATPTPGTPAGSAPATPMSTHKPLPLPGAMPPDEDDDEDDETSEEGSPRGTPSRRDSSATTSPSFGPIRTHTRTEKVTLSAPTLLLRIYGPQSGSLISRRNELHILHTLSSQYGIGAHVLGTFGNGRVEEYFHSRALLKEEMRDERISRWIGRRMREMHSVELAQMQPPPRDEDEEEEMRRRRSRSVSGGPGSERGDSLERRPGIDPVPQQGSRSPHSGASIYSTSSSSSVFSFGTSSSSSWSGYSTGSSIRSSSTLGSGSGTYGSLVSSPGLLPQRTPSESQAQEKKRPRRRGGSTRSWSGSGSSAAGGSGRRRTKQWSSGTRDKLCVWENITRWTREAKLVLKELDELAQLPGFATLLAARSAASTPGGPASPLTREQKEQGGEHVQALSHPSLTLYLRSVLNLPLFEHQLRMYRSYVRRVERGTPVAATTTSSSSSSSAPHPHPFTSLPPTHPLRSKRVFTHNDTQYGNLLLVTPKTDDPAEEEEIERQARREGGAHRRLIVVDFEYAGANPRGFDIANHFCEWQADYHHPSLSHSLSLHQPYPTHAEQVRFLRAYVGCDGGLDVPPTTSSSSTTSSTAAGAKDPQEKEDPRVDRLLDEVRLWQPSSHALWAVWGIVQAKEDLMARIDVWKQRAARVAASSSSPGAASPPSASPLPSPTVAPIDGGLVDSVKALNLSEADAAGLADLSELDEVGEVFDYLSYAAERMGMFRRELDELGVML